MKNWEINLELVYRPSARSQELSIPEMGKEQRLWLKLPTQLKAMSGQELSGQLLDVELGKRAVLC